MEIIFGKNSGFCYGVKRAVEGTLEEINQNKGKTIYCLGELVHNKQVIEELEKKGIKFINNIEEVSDKNAVVIIRAHGIAQEIYKQAEKQNLKLVDYTCNNVLKIHKIVNEYQENNYYIVVIGVKNHPEVKATITYCGKNYSVIENEEDIQNTINNIKDTNAKKVLVISQTTYSTKKFEDIIQILKTQISKDVDLIIKNTICLTTEQRQSETKELSKKVDLMIIIGGKNSSNTKKLYEIAKENCKNAICIETKDDIIEPIQEGTIGIMAGASTPQSSIDEVVEFLKGNEW